MLSSLIDVGAVASGVVIGALAIGGVITAGAAFAAAGDILAILAAVVVIVGLFEASEEREVSIGTAKRTTPNVYHMNRS